MEDYLGALENAEGFDGEKLGVAGAGADEEDFCVTGGGRKVKIHTLKIAGCGTRFFGKDGLGHQAAPSELSVEVACWRKRSNIGLLARMWSRCLVVSGS